MTPTKTLAAVGAAATIAIAAIAAPSDAQARGGWVPGAVIGGLAAGAIVGGALAARPYYYGGGPYYAYSDGPYYGDRCYWRRVWTDWGPRRQRVCY
jgi:hypothetical protein